MKKLDCGSNSCLFAEKRGGMRTNGGCGCLRELTGKNSQIPCIQELVLMYFNSIKEVETLKNNIKDLEEAYNKMKETL
jgi:hypothetical protein